MICPTIQLESQLEAQESERTKSARSVRNVDRTVKDLQTQIERKDKQATQLTEDAARLRDRVEKLLGTIDELQASESDHQLSARRAERELREEREKARRLERELEGWKNLRMEKGGSVRIGTPSLVDGVVGGGGRRLSNLRHGSVSGSVAGGDAGGSPADDTASLSGGNGVEVPKRKSSLSRQPSLTKGFL